MKSIITPIPSSHRRLEKSRLYEYDFGARRHYPRFPAFTTPDPHADNTPWLSPYVFCAANPVTYVDPSGMDTYKVNTNTGIIRSIGFYGRELADDNPMAHEFGHMLVLKDRYVNKTVPPEWKGNVMAEPATENVKVDSRNMTGVLGNALNGYPHN